MNRGGGGRERAVSKKLFESEKLRKNKWVLNLWKNNIIK